MTRSGRFSRVSKKGKETICMRQAQTRKKVTLQIKRKNNKETMPH